MLEIQISEKPKPKLQNKPKHFKDCFWKDRVGNISFAECPYCQIYDKIKHLF